jgi:phospholipase C
MGSRRDFIKKAGILAGGAGVWNSMPDSIRKAVAINPDKGTTFADAEHVVLLMQENRSFDHVFGTLQGVRGFRDPRAVTLPDGNLAFLQSDARGRTFAPFRLDIRDTRATWMSYLPHSWASQVDARNGGRHDNWLEAKRSGNKAYADMPLTLGYYNRQDVPFYYALADAFTVCDQHFCSSLTGTTPNRLFYWTGTIREEQNGLSPANVDNSDVNYHSPAGWTTFPERLEAQGISWKVYQNELSVGVGFKGEEDAWLANYTDNPLEWFSQYHVRFLPAHLRYLKERAAALAGDISALENTAAPDAGNEKELTKKKRELRSLRETLTQYTRDKFEKLPSREQRLHEKAFATNSGDPDYHRLTTLRFREQGSPGQMQIPAGDVLFRFRKDVQEGNLPTVSWIVAPENFSDHPSAPWYGAWYVSEVLDILTKNPEVWKKTIFILTYDENDGYFDHVPPFTPPDPTDPATGKCSEGIDTTVDYVTAKQAAALKGKPKDPKRVSPVGLGYRVPFIVASPWSRGGWVNSQVFDNTSVLMFLEHFLAGKTGKTIREDNISSWRRTICGDLSSVFRPYNGETIGLPPFIKKEPFLESIYEARFKKVPSGYQELSPKQIRTFNADPAASPLLYQEQGVRPACAVPYQLYAEGKQDGGAFVLTLKSAADVFGKRAAGAPFIVYDMHGYRIRNYAVRAGDVLQDTLPIGTGENGRYHFRVCGPNGFYREFRGDRDDAGLSVHCEYEKQGISRLSGNILLQLHHNENKRCAVEIRDNRSDKILLTTNLEPHEGKEQALELGKDFGWYDFSVTCRGNDNFIRRYAGHVETGGSSFTDPLIGG